LPAWKDGRYLLANKWRETNTKWIDSTGKQGDWVTLRFDRGHISDRTSFICFALAKDLIDAYHRFGYQIFESNVRCEIAKSQVNDAIKRQVGTEKGIDEFRILNNGITVVCANRKAPSNGRVELHQPQVVNGLQTITSLFEAYEKLPPTLKSHFEESCYVLTRMYDRQAIIDLPKLVRATNNQNKMEQRNLRSNDPDQISFEKYFANLKWFYERKDFAWNAFEQNENQWGTLKGFSARHFKVEGRAGRPLIRRVDNQAIGQHWLAFLGYVDDAAQRRRLIFEEDKYYTRIFQSRMVKGAYDYNYEIHVSCIGGGDTDCGPKC
jgi:AIPR protein